MAVDTSRGGLTSSGHLVADKQQEVHFALVHGHLAVSQARQKLLGMAPHQAVEVRCRAEESSPDLRVWGGRGGGEGGEGARA